LAKRFVDNPRIRDTRFKNEVAKIANAARKRKVEYTVLSTTEGEFSEKMLEEWKKHEGTAEGEEFLYTAFVKYKGEGNVAGVFDFGGRLIGAYPQSKRLVDVFGTMAAFAAKAGDFDRAAVLFEEYHKRFPRQKNANDMLMRAATIRTFLGEVDKAARDLRALRSAGTAQQKVLAHQNLMEIYRDIGDWSSLARVAQTALQANSSWTAAASYLGVAYAEQGKDELAERELQRAVRMRPNGQFDLEAKSRALFAYGQYYHRQFDGLQFSDPASAEQILASKLQLREVVEQAYNAAASGGVGEWAIAAIHELARLHAAMGQALSSVPLPQMNQQELAAVRAQLKQQADQWISSANEMKKACATKAEQLKILTKFGSACATGGAPTVSGVTKRRRGGSGGDAYLQEMAALRQELAKKESIETVKKMVVRTMQVGDYHLAKLLLSKASELNPNDANVQNLLGVTAWQLGDPQSAHEALEKAARRRHQLAQFNLAALYFEYGYQRLARKWLSAAGSPASLDTGRVDLHPSVEKLKEDVGS
jgi:tetratricopeptide (TPR) repeat protein